MAIRTGEDSFHRGKTTRSRHVTLTKEQWVYVPGAKAKYLRLEEGKGKDSHILWAVVRLDNGAEVRTPAAAVRPA